MNTTETVDLVERVRHHRLYTHPIWEHWVQAEPSPDVLGALFHQIQRFCASTRPGWVFPDGLRKIGLERQAELLEEIVSSEAGHGPELATMAAHIINRASIRASGDRLFSELCDQSGVEGWLKGASDRVLGTLPGYDAMTGLTVQARQAIAVFERRKSAEPGTVLQNLGTALALEVISNQELIPGEKCALVDSGLYGVSLEEPEMHYLKEHWGECGAERQHEANVVRAIEGALSEENEDLIRRGVDDFLNSLARLWDVLDAALLKSGCQEAAWVLGVEEG